MAYTDRLYFIYYRLLSNISRWLRPHSSIKSIIGNKLSPKSVRKYSTFAGMTGYIILCTIPMFSNSFSCCVRTLLSAIGIARCISIGRWCPSLKRFMSQGFYLPPITFIVTSIPHPKFIGIFRSYMVFLCKDNVFF